jgi:futalosine hydrolase
MDILLVSATRAEVAPLTEDLGSRWQPSFDGVFSRNGHSLQLLITGVGAVATTYNLSKILAKKNYDLVIQVGIAGSFNRTIPLCEVVQVQKERFGDLGAEDHYNFIDVYDMGLVNADEFPFSAGELIAPPVTQLDQTTLRQVSSLTVHTVSGSSFTATARDKKYGCDLESMEGAAFHFVCLQERVPFAQLRSVSNYVEARDRSKWKIEEAVKNLNDWLIRFLDQLSGL